MHSGFHTFKVILLKHYLIRTSTIKSIILSITELSIPILIFLLITYTRSQIQFDKQYVNHSTTVDPILKDDLLTKISVGSTQILFAPDNQFTSSLVRDVQLKLHLYNEDIHPFISKAELIHYYNNYEYKGATVVIFFNNINNHAIPKHLDYDIKIYEDGVIWETDKLFGFDFAYVAGSGSENYLDKAFGAVQLALDTSFIEMVTKKPLNLSLTFQEFPYPPYLNTDGVTNIFRHVLPFLTIISFIFICPVTLKRIVLEKSSGLKELLKISGVKSWMIWCGWFLNGILMNFISILIIAALLTLKIFNVEYALIEHCSYPILVIFLLMYCTSTTTFLFAFSTLFNRGTLAMVFGVLLWIISYVVFIGFAANIEIMSVLVKAQFLLFPTVGLYYGYNTISIYEMRDRDITMSNLFKSPTESSDDLSLGTVIVMLFFDTCLYFWLTLYLDKIWPGPYGISKPWYFIFEKPMKLFGKNIVGEQPENHPLCEETNLKPALRMKDVTKVYDNAVAVNKLSIEIYEGTITSLLGENGAGKSTTMSMLIGLTKATSGDIFINERNIKNDVNEARKKVSICPQNNLLYNDLSVLMHLKLFGMLKGLSCKEATKQATELINDTLKLDVKANTFAHALSGGMKRKLSLGIALMGNPEIVILDEPTTGIDIEGRREIWNLIMSFKGKKTVLISTHFIEEAEHLSDRIAIMDHGQLLCYGTPMHLKNVYNVGFNCTINCERDKNEAVNIAKSYVKEDAIKSNYNNNIIRCYIDNESRAKVPKMLKELENKQFPYKLASTTLEDIYLKVQGKENISQNKVDTLNRRPVTPPVDIQHKIYDFVLWDFPNYAYKRKIFAKKKWRQHIPMILLGMATVILTFAMADSGYKDVSQDGTRLALRLNTYGMTDVYYSISGTVEHTPLENYYKEIVVNEKGSPKRVENVFEEIIAKGIDNIAHYKKRMIIATEFAFSGNNVSAINLMHSNGALHGAPISINVVMNTLLRYFAGKEYSISASNTPLHSTEEKDQGFSQSEANNVFLWLTLLPIGVLLIICNVLLLPTIEYAKSIRVLENLCGINPFKYWLFNFVIDGLTYIFIILILCLILVSFGYLPFQNDTFGTFFGVLAAYGWMCIPFAYFFTFTSTVESSYSMFLIVHVLIAPIVSGVLMVLQLLPQFQNSMTWKYILFLDPHVLLCYVLANFARKLAANHNWDIMSAEARKFLCFENPVPCCNPDSKECAADRAYVDEAGYLFGFAVITGVIYLFLLTIGGKVLNLISKKFTKILSKKTSTQNQSPSRNLFQNLSQNEIDQIDGGANNVISVKQVTKSYATLRSPFFVTAVKKLTFSLKKGDCFGLLGVNGAGKSTSFRILTSELIPTEGDLVTNNATIGYCPQHDALIDDLSGRELLRLFGNFRKIDTSELEGVVDQLLIKFGLQDIADKPCGVYSGGNKRKLSTCISIIGKPNCILLDEPTSGVDPVSRRELWDLIEQIKSEKETGIILTSHSMDECEALCDRLCILKEGVVKARNTIEKLKETYCIGHVVKVKLGDNATGEDEEIFLTDLNKKLQEARKKRKENQSEDVEKNNEKKAVERIGIHNSLLHIRILNSNWPEILETMERLKNEDKSITDYWAKEASLEEVFLQIAQSNEITVP